MQSLSPFLFSRTASDGWVVGLCAIKYPLRCAKACSLLSRCAWPVCALVASHSWPSSARESVERGKGVFCVLGTTHALVTHARHTLAAGARRATLRVWSRSASHSLSFPPSLNYHCVHTLRTAHLFNPLLELLEADMMGRREREGTHEG